MYIPERGDLVWLHFEPQSGHEQSGHRPGLVMTPAAYNGLVGLAIICPVTSKVKGYPFEVVLPDSGPVRGAILADQARSLDWQARKATLITKAPGSVVDEVLGKLESLLQR